MGSTLSNELIGKKLKIPKQTEHFKKIASPLFLDFSGENILRERSIYDYLEKIFKITKLNIIFLNKYFPNNLSKIKISKRFPFVLKNIKKIEKMEDIFILTSNKFGGKNVFSIPYFINYNYDKVKKIIKNNLKERVKKRKFCAFIVSEGCARERVIFYKKLSKYKKIDSYGKIFNNMGDKNLHELSTGKYLKNSEIFKKYKFVICFENSFEENWITEKILNVMVAGAIPIYRGAPNIQEYFNNESFINYEDYRNYDKMIQKIIELDNNSAKYKDLLSVPFLSKENIQNINKKVYGLKHFLNKLKAF